MQEGLHEHEKCPISPTSCCLNNLFLQQSGHFIFLAFIGGLENFRSLIGGISILNMHVQTFFIGKMLRPILIFKFQQLLTKYL